MHKWLAVTYHQYNQNCKYACYPQTQNHINEHRIPTNCRFEVDDVEDEWNYSQKFDLIHGRAMVTCFKDPLAVIKSAFSSLKPGGYLELQDLILPQRAIDDTLRGTAIDKIAELSLAAAVRLGTSWD